LQRESTAWDLRCQGWTHTRIAERLGLTRRAIGQILDRVEARELSRLSHSVGQAHAHLFAHLAAEVTRLEAEVTSLRQQLAAAS
jgi:hypothetical protein